MHIGFGHRSAADLPFITVSCIDHLSWSLYRVIAEPFRSGKRRSDAEPTEQIRITGALRVFGSQ